MPHPYQPTATKKSKRSSKTIRKNCLGSKGYDIWMYCYNEGRQVSLRALRGSGALEQLSDGVIAMERDQQGVNPNESVIRVLKNRPIGRTGLVYSLTYSPDTGRLMVEDVADFLGNATKESENLDF